MASIKVQVLYEFTGEPGSDELSIREGEVLTVTRQDVGEGWWEGRNSEGRVGLFPAAYVANYETADFWNEEWDDDESASTGGGGGSAGLYENAPVFTPSSQIAPPIPSTAPAVPATVAPSTRPLRARKHGGESFIMGMSKLPVPDEEVVQVVIGSDGSVVWASSNDPYSCSVASPKKESKLKGLKSYIAYQLTPSFNGIQVSRRYKHFDWLHERLEEKFCVVVVPPLPEKTIASRYEDVFVERRRQQLQAFVDYVCRHPVLSSATVWNHFITCTDERLWKNGKRRAEKDELVGGAFLHAVTVPAGPPTASVLESATAGCTRLLAATDHAAKLLADVAADHAKKSRTIWRRDLQKAGAGLYALGQALATDGPPPGVPRLTDALKAAGDAYSDVGKMYEAQPKRDWDPLADMLHVLRGVLTAMPDVLANHKRALQTKRDCEKLAFEQKMTMENLEEVNRRTDVFSYALMAEIHHVHRDTAEQVSATVKSFLREQMLFYQTIASKLEEAYNAFDG